MEQNKKYKLLPGYLLLAALILCALIQTVTAFSVLSLIILLLSLGCAGAALWLRRSAPVPQRREPAEEYAEEPIGWRQGNRQLLGFIERLLKGCENQRIHGVQIPMQSPFFVVFGVDIMSESPESSPEIEAEARRELRVCNVLAEAFSQHSFWPMNIDGMLTCVVNLRPIAEDPLQAETMNHIVIPLMRRAVEVLEQDGIRIRIATSGLTAGLDSLSRAYQDTLEIFDQLVLMDPAYDNAIFVVDPRENNLPSNHIVRSQTERLFCNYITTQDFENARLALLKLTEYETAEQEFSLVIKKLTGNRLEWTLNVLSAALTDAEYQHLHQKIQTISEAAYAEDLTRSVNDWFSELEESFRPQPRDSLIPNVIGYVAENCFSPELSVARISEHFNVSASYLSSSFHSQVGCRLIDFIHQQRIKKVKQLLRETDLTVAQIAESTGYYNTMTMSRAFKRYEGVTPSAYREQ